MNKGEIATILIIGLLLSWILFATIQRARWKLCEGEREREREKEAIKMAEAEELPHAISGRLSEIYLKHMCYKKSRIPFCYGKFQRLNCCGCIMTL